MKKIGILLFLLLFYCNIPAQNFKFGKVSEEEIYEKEHPLEPEANAAVLYRNHTTYYEINKHTGFTLITKVHERIKIYNKDGFKWSNKEINHFRNGSDSEKITRIKGVTYNLENGKIKEEKLGKNGIFEEEVTEYKLKTTLTMPAVTEGSVIEYTYTLRSPFITAIDIIPMQYMIPLNRLETKVSIPEFFGFKKHFNPKSEVQFNVDESSTLKTYQRGSKNELDYKLNMYAVELDNVPALKTEAYVDYLHNYAAYLQWELEYTKFPNSMMKFYSQSWEEVAETIFKEEGYNKELNRTNFFDDYLDEVLKAAYTKEEKIKHIYNFLKEKIKWNEYLGYTSIKGTRSAYKNGEGNVGDVNLTLISMLRYAGINAYPVLVSTRRNGIPIIPTRNGFNYVIAGIELPERTLLLDGTDLTAAPGDLPKRARNWQGRMIRDDGSSEWVNLMPTYQSENRVTLNLKLQEDLIFQGRTSRIHTGLYAKDYREKYSSMKLDEYMEELHSNKGNIKITNLMRKNIESPGKDVKETYDFELENGLEMINGKIYLKPLLFLALRENPFKAETRTYPIFFDYPSINTEVVNPMIPEGYKFESLPESFVSELNAGEIKFSFFVNQNKNFLRIKSVVDYSNTVYNPQDYHTLKKFYNYILEKQTETVVISKI